MGHEAGPVECSEVKDGAIVCKPGKGGNLHTKDTFLRKNVGLLPSDRYDPDAISRLREVGDEIIRFSNDELELTQRTVAALASGNTSELQSIQNLMQEKLCDFRRNVDNKAFPLPDKYRFFFPEQISCS